MRDKPNEQIKRAPLSESLSENEAALTQIFDLPKNNDFAERDLEIGGAKAKLYFLQGMAKGERIDQFVIQPCLNAREKVDMETLARTVLCVSECALEDTYGKVVEAVLCGKTALLLDGSNQAAVLDTRSWVKRAVDKTNTESVIMGPQEGFVEDLRSNVTLLRRILRTELLVGEEMQIGTQVKTRAYLLYVKGVVKTEALDTVRRRVQSVDAPRCANTGALMQMIEDHPFSMFPQMLETERPDRVATMLSAGQVALMVEGSPFTLIAPVTIFHLMHASDDAYLRWQSGTFLRLVRALGAFLSLTFPALYIALTMHHSHMIPMDLLTSIAETRAKVPFPVVVEVLIMEMSFFLINEAGARIPSLIGPTIGIVGALILGQAAVSADIISPILIIIVAVTGLGSYCVPNYAVNLGISILRLMLVAVSCVWGLYGMIIALGILIARLCSMRSFGEPFLAPFAPYVPHNPDLILRLPVWLQNRHMFLARKNAWTRGRNAGK